MEIFNPFQVSSRSLLLWKAALLELVTDSSGQNISHQLPIQAMKHTRRAIFILLISGSDEDFQLLEYDVTYIVL